MKITVDSNKLIFGDRITEFAFPIGVFAVFMDKVFLCFKHPPEVVNPENLVCWNLTKDAVEWRIQSELYVLPAGRSPTGSDRIVGLRLEESSEELFIFTWDGPTICIDASTFVVKYREGRRWGLNANEGKA